LSSAGGAIAPDGGSGGQAAVIAPITAACIAAAAAAYNLSPLSLQIILKTEGGHVGACTVQHNGMHDCGPAQVNAEIWVPRVAALLHRPVAQIFYAIRDNGCFNIDAAAYILRVKVGEAQGDIWDGMGRYNSATPSVKHAYQAHLVEAYKRLFRAEAPRHPKPDHAVSREAVSREREASR